MIGVGVADDDTVQSFDAPAPEEVDHFGTRLRLSGVEQVILATRLDEHSIDLPHVYKAHDQRAFGRRLGGARFDSCAAGHAEERGQKNSRGACLPPIPPLIRGLRRV